MERNTPKAFSKYTDCRTFILISTLATWAKTKPIDPVNTLQKKKNKNAMQQTRLLSKKIILNFQNDPELAFTEADYRKRKPHPNYKIHCEFEKRVIEIGKRVIIAPIEFFF